MAKSQVLLLEDYAETISLREPFVVATPPSSVSRERLVQQILEYLESERSQANRGGEIQNARQRLRALLTVRGPQPLPVAINQAIDLLLQAEATSRQQYEVDQLPSQILATDQNAQLVLWRGDITTLAADAIVNAANSELLGCFRPFHNCIDNAIHTVAGPRLREDCSRIIDLQGCSEPVGYAKATRAYQLPSRYVLHTVGPIVRGNLTAQHQEELASCYRACLDTAIQLKDVSSVAFCSVSTGVFGFPAEEAAVVAINTVRSWLQHNPNSLDKVVFDVFTEEDYARYKTLLSR